MNDYITATEILDFVYCNRRWYLHTLEQKSNENEYKRKYSPSGCT